MIRQHPKQHSLTQEFLDHLAEEEIVSSPHQYPLQSPVRHGLV